MLREGGTTEQALVRTALTRPVVRVVGAAPNLVHGCVKSLMAIMVVVPLVRESHW